mmetsp:Transcript_21156/g.36320  ORF Transcript_21156/g.36320 Transcript_21156/m.36320 type:complete len:348 (-) Transcript_21156:812-1855(-)|eukprot:CAMPEP_0196659472 /NCGR_PEP_ID=MMETSP1086-20130531/35214_1 /TAXON_ID=77921 /ORGANISM="Cyanoptyche  gloeocystis , Strain SAG4.97" /LENGTH=347 /DNA_ID=CAMNT_0041993475 /DNA_START=79 /DNA_END=1122 /DNA_ORIENTATION=-
MPTPEAVPQKTQQKTPTVEASSSQKKAGIFSSMEANSSANKIPNATPTIEVSTTNSNKAPHMSSSLEVSSSSKKFPLLSVHGLGQELKEGFSSAGGHLRESFHVWSHPEETRPQELRRSTEVRRSREMRRSVDKRSNPDHNSGRKGEVTTVTNVSPSGDLSKVVMISMSGSEAARVVPERRALSTPQGSPREHLSVQERRNNKLRRNGCYKFTRFIFFAFTFVLCFPFACFCGYAVTRCLDRTVMGTVRFFMRPFRKDDDDDDDDCYDDEEEDGEYGQCQYDEEEGEYSQSQNGDAEVNSQGASAHGSKTASAHGSRTGSAHGSKGGGAGHASNRPPAVVASALVEP